MLFGLNKYILIVIGLALVIVIVIVALFAVQRSRSNSSSGGTAGGNLDRLSFATGYADVSIKNFVDSATSIDGGTVTIFRDLNSGVFIYNSADRLFTLTLNENDSAKVKTKQVAGEAQILKALDIGRGDACLLPIDVRNEGAVNEYDKLLTLLMCPYYEK